MTDPIAIVERLLFLLLTPGFLLMPILWAWLTPNRATEESQRTQVRIRMAALVIFTMVALAVWVAMLILSTQLPAENPLASVHRHLWVVFFPLWSGLAMPVVREKSVDRERERYGEVAARMEVRSASLVNRSQDSPIETWEWVTGIALSVVCAVGIALRGLLPMTTVEGAEPGQTSWLQWVIALSVYSFCIGLQWFIVPYSVRLALVEPEPMDVTGSHELQTMYRSHRKRKIRMLYWLTGVLLPTFMGLMIIWMVWWPEHSRILGLIGGVGGACLGLCGGYLGMKMSAERMRIAEFKAKLDANAGVQ